MGALMSQASLWRCLPTLCWLEGFSWLLLQTELGCLADSSCPVLCRSAGSCHPLSAQQLLGQRQPACLPARAGEQRLIPCLGPGQPAMAAPLQATSPHRLKPVAELLPFDGDILDEESALREAGAFPEDYAPEHAAHAAPALWWPHSAAQRSAPSALLVPELPTHHADSGQVISGRPWGSHMVSLANLSLSRFQHTISH